MLCMINFTTANIYNMHEHTLTCDLKNYMTPLRNINRRVPVEKVLRSSLAVLKTDRTFWIFLLTLAKTEMHERCLKSENWMSFIAFP